MSFNTHLYSILYVIYSIPHCSGESASPYFDNLIHELGGRVLPQEEDETGRVYAPSKFPQYFHHSRFGNHVAFQGRLRYCHHPISCGDRIYPGPAWTMNESLSNGTSCVCENKKKNRCYEGRCVKGQNVNHNCSL